MDPHQARRGPAAAIIAGLVIIAILASLFSWLGDGTFLETLLWIAIPFGFWTIYAVLTLDQDKEPSDR